MTDKTQIAFLFLMILLAFCLGMIIGNISETNEIFNQKYLLAQTICGEERTVTIIKEIKPSGTIPISFEIVCKTDYGRHDMYSFDLMNDKNMIQDYLNEKYWKMKINTVLDTET